ncbi:MAG: MBL fold metallo-hydrolase [Cyclobacteriaceae bacterium]|nr:MBL fold metallo-hydrolase [Cyclobacteriaceae bacterium]
MIHTIDTHFQGLEHAIASYLVETSGGLVLIETGPHSTLPSLLAGLEDLGFRADQVRHVLLSHVHLDHAGAAWYFADLGAKIYVHPLGLPHLSNPERLMASATRIYGEDMDRLWGEMRPIDELLLQAVQHQQSITIGDQTFISYHTPGHAVHHIAWALEDNLFTGDIAGVKILQGPVVPPCPPPDINIEHWMQSLELIKSLPFQQLYLTHYGRISDISRHIKELEDCLESWSQWIYRQYQAKVAVDECIAPFQLFVAQQLTSKGLSAKEIEIYEAANPSWMSVFGLYRFWSKKSS